MTWILTFIGFALLIILHELGHFAAAKAVGMRVERFSLFFPPLLGRVRRGETEYAIGAIPLGGYVKISGMNPAEELAPDVARRAYYNQPVWKRIVVISAGPAVNILLAFVILWAVFLARGELGSPASVARVEPGKPAAAVLKPGDQILAVDGRAPAGDAVDAQMDSIGKAIAASGAAVSGMWSVTSQTVSKIAQIFKPEERKQLGSVVGGYEATRQALSYSTTDALILLAVISLSLGVVNLFTFLPLDGGHIFWALAEKLRGRAIPFSVMERAGFIGFALVIGLFVIGFTNDLGRLTGDGFGVR
jgi:regulator of sigma E protease